ncbi:serine hydrolase domain-containing protein [Maribellus sediminis]|uniref:serine hydrolase domain-containing protein n=1 Tax=Maribellus sediminis TaxID=2696285 RepID=UPI0014314841|nr:serine hydrolase domain-containing protein [Maribellus sediminis]
MKNVSGLLLVISFAAILSSCNSKQPSASNAGSSVHSYSETYKAPAFVNDNRIEQIKQIAPEIQKSIEERAETAHIPGIAFGIVVDNELVFATATGLANIEKGISATPTSAFRIASMTKSFTAMAILKLRDEGKLQLSDPANKYIPEMANLKYLTSDAPVIDIENLLTMTAGFPEDNPWGDRQLDESDQMLMDLIGEGVSFSNAPSYEFEYSNTGYALLGNIITRVSGIPYQEYITQNILLPLGMEHTYWEIDSVPEEQLVIGYRREDEQWKLEPMLHDGSFGAMGGLITTIEDFSKYVSFHLSAWPPRNEADNGPVKRSSLREMQTPQFPSLYADAKDYNGNPCPALSGYGFGLGITEYCNGIKRVSHGGALPGFGSNYTFYPDYGIGIMAFCNLTYTSPWSLAEISKLLFETADLQPRKLPVSDILLERKEQLTQLIQNWEPELEEKILAENFYLDQSREKRMATVKQIPKKVGIIQEVGELEPENQLRGSFKLHAEHGDVVVFFTLTPEKAAKVQQLDISFKENETK